MVTRARLEVELLRDLGEVAGMGSTAGLELAQGLQLLAGVLANRLEHPEARLAVRVRLLAQEALLDQ